jgi:ubiquitin carboxyl-terminal hydrolase 4/11/15
VSTPVRVPTRGLDLSPFLAAGAACDGGGAGPYDLFAAANHFGGLHGGHYTSVAQTVTKDWLYFDDSESGLADAADLACSAAPYVLFYRRRGDPDSVQCA